MLTKRSEVRASLIPGAGMGCFLLEPVAKGEVLWVYDSRLDIIFTEEEVEAMPPVKREFVRHYAYLDKVQFSGFWVLHAGNDRFCNHSETPTMVDRLERKGEIIYTMVATRDLVPGDEVTCDYRTFDDRSLRERRIGLSE